MSTHTPSQTSASATGRGTSSAHDVAPSPLIRVAVITGGTSSEHEVSIASAASAVAALDSDRYAVTELLIARDGSWSVDGAPASAADAVAALSACDVCLPLVHGPGGEDGSLAALCGLVGVPVAGSGIGAGAIGMDKWASKLIAEAIGVRTAPAQLLRRGDAAPAVELPVVVKPVRAGSSQGVSLVEDAAALPAAIDEAFAEDDRVLIEEVQRGREIDVAVLRKADGTLLVAPPLEIVVPGLFDFDAKYGGGATFLLPADLDAATGAALADAAERIYLALGCSGVARVDFFVTDSGIVFNEANTTPGFTSTSQVPLMLAEAGLPYPALLDELIAAALPAEALATAAR